MRLVSLACRRTRRASKKRSLSPDYFARLFWNTNGNLMEIAKDFVIPLVIALITVVVTAIVTIQITYSSTKEEALRGLKSLGSATLYYVWLAYLIFSLFFVVASEEPITRPDAFK